MADKIITFPFQSGSATGKPARRAKADQRNTVQAQMLLAEIGQAFRCQRMAYRHTPDTITRDEAIVADFLGHARKLPWECTTTDLVRYFAHLSCERKLVYASQRCYQGAVRSYFGFIVKTERFVETIQRLYGVRMRQLATEDVCIAHVHDRELATERGPMSFEQVTHFFSVLDRTIDEAFEFRGKDRYLLLRDRTLFYLLYAMGFRIGETLDLDLGAFAENPELSELGNCGFISVRRKGSNGSGPKFQEVATDSPGLPPMVEWYMAEVRSHFVLKQKSLEEAPVFFDERGGRLKYTAAYERLKLALGRAGLDGMGFSFHSFRRTMTTQESLTMSLEALRIKLGHVHLATTMLYLRVPDEFVRVELANVVRERLAASKKGGK